MLNRPPDSFFISVHRSGVNQPITGMNGIHHTLLTLSLILNLKNAESGSRHFYAVIECNGIHWEHLLICYAFIVAPASRFRKFGYVIAA